jgi:protein gp37
MNKTKIEWTDYSWNPITGCKHGCWYCYARRLCLRFKKIFPNGFEPTFYPERLKEPWDLKKPSKIFVCSISDLFASWTPCEWRDQVMVSIYQCPVKHTFQLLTKNPERIPWHHAWYHQHNVWIGTTVTNTDGDWRNIEEIKKEKVSGVRFVSFEPILGELPANACLEGIDWVIIGKLTGSQKIKLDPWWVASVYNEARRHDIPVFMKNNLKPTFEAKYQEFPEVGG